MSAGNYGRVLDGNEESVWQGYEALDAQPVDLAVDDPGPEYAPNLTGLAGTTSVTGRGTFFGQVQRTLALAPSEKPGWWIDRHDLPDSLPVKVSIENVWTTGAIVSNIVLRSGSPHNYLRMVEHIVALRVGLGLDNILITVDSGDPPLFDRGSLDLVDAVEEAGIVATDQPAEYVTVKETVTMTSPNGGFLTLQPASNGSRKLTVDCAISFPNAIGKQRVQFTVNPELVRMAAVARTNTNLWTMLYCRSVGKIFADIRHLGYTTSNLLVAGPNKYFNEPRLLHGGKSLEAAWHRAVLDLLAAIALIDRGRFAGHITSYKAGHALDCRLVTKLYQQDLLTPLG